MIESQLSRGDFLRRGAGAAITLASLGSLGLDVPAAFGARAGASYTYTVWTFDNSDSYKNTKKAFADAGKMVKPGGVSFNMSNLSGSGAALYPSKIQSLIASGQPPDTWESWGGSLAKPYLDAKAVLALDPWYNKYGWRKSLSPAAISLISVGGHPYGVPFNVISMPMFYNKTLFAQAGVTPPKTYDEWEQTNAALTKAGIQAYTQGGIYGWDLMRLFEHLLETTAGPQLHDELIAFNTGWNKPQVVDAFGLLKKWGDNWLPKGFIGMNPNDTTLMFTSGKAAQNLEGGWIVDQIKGAGSNPDDYGFFVPPGDKGPARMAGFVQQYLVSNKLSGDKLDALGKFFNAFVSPAIQQKYLINGSTATKNGVPRNGEPLLAQYMATTLGSKLYLIQDQAMSPKLANAYFALQSGVCNGSTTPQAAAAKMDAAVKKYQA